MSGKEYVVVTVKDSGNGLSTVIQAAMAVPGIADTGLDAAADMRLAAVRDTLLRNGGGFTVETSPSRGSRFNAYLPVGG